MDFKALRWQILRGSLARRLLLKAFLFALAMAIISFIQIVHDVRIIEPLMLGSSLLTPCKESDNLTLNVFKELMEKDLLDSGAKALCVGDGSATAVTSLRELGFSNAFGVERHPFFSFSRKRFVHELDFEDNYFDFVFSRALDRVSVPALLVREIERVMRPGGTGAMLVGANDFYSGGLIRAATPVSSFLRSSSIVHVCGIGSFTLVIFKKKFDSIESFEHYRLRDECSSVMNNLPFIKYLEPLVRKSPGQFKTELSYLPKFMNMSSRKRLIYINIGAGEFVNVSIAKIFKPYYPLQPQAFNVYVVDHDTSALSAYVKKPGVTFVYFPGLGGVNPTANSDGDKGFDFISWFKETIEEGDFVVLMMNAKAVELKILFQLFESGGICNVDELFLRCSDSVDCKDAVCGDCMTLFEGLRKSGVFVHQWWGN
ncbi:hypothetical protein F0562_021789 [Nyssa sinensis]|uniref:Uncharacterized protein n=1 Tax=Nyssa sinensis TaxID=561372 RepID=A0A5J5BMY1_9ASTE|nr:hypothetical protein F0562_021789 [Nyssa sinensis]